MLNIFNIIINLTAKTCYFEKNLTVKQTFFIAYIKAVTNFINPNIAIFTVANNYYKILYKYYKRFILKYIKLKE